MKYFEQIKCMVCGGRLEKQESGIYKCDYCGAEYERTDIEQYVKAIRMLLREEVSDALAEQRNRDIGNARQNLYAEIKAEYISSNNVIVCCHKLKEYLPEDFQANTFEILNSGSKKQINKWLDNIDEKGEGRYYIKDILDFMLRSLVTANVLSLKSLADRALNGEEKTRYLNAIEEEAEKYNEGMYNPKIPRKAFIAYSSNDMQRVNEIVNYLEESGISCFVALRNLRHGRGSVENYGKILEEAMHNCKCFVLISSHNSRRLDCDAMDKELPYVRDHEPQVKRIEYIIDDYGNEGGAKAILKDFFGTSEQPRHPNLDDLVKRIFNGETQKSDKFQRDNKVTINSGVARIQREQEEELSRKKAEAEIEMERRKAEAEKELANKIAEAENAIAQKQREVDEGSSITYGNEDNKSVTVYDYKRRHIYEMKDVLKILRYVASVLLLVIDVAITVCLCCFDDPYDLPATITLVVLVGVGSLLMLLFVIVRIIESISDDNCVANIVFSICVAICFLLVTVLGPLLANILLVGWPTVFVIICVPLIGGYNYMVSDEIDEYTSDGLNITMTVLTDVLMVVFYVELLVTMWQLG